MRYFEVDYQLKNHDVVKNFKVKGTLDSNNLTVELDKEINEEFHLVKKTFKRSTPEYTLFVDFNEMKGEISFNEFDLVTPFTLEYGSFDISSNLNVAFSYDWQEEVMAFDILLKLREVL